MTLRDIATYPTEKMVRITVAKRNAAGAPRPLPKPTTSGVLKSIAEMGADPVTVRNSTPASPTACLRSIGTSRCETSNTSASACASVRGKPSRTKPPSVSSSASRSRMSPIMRSSGTRCPLS